MGTGLALLLPVGVLLHRSDPTRVFLATIVLVAAVSACGRGRPVAPKVSQRDLHAALASMLATSKPPQFVVRDRTGRQLWTATRKFYQKHGFSPAWLNDDAPPHRIDDLLRALQQADLDALDPSRYEADDVAALRQKLPKTSMPDVDRLAAALDARLTYLYLQYASDLANGVTIRHPGRVPGSGDAFNPVGSLEDALAHDAIGERLRDLQQRNPEFAALRNALAAYRRIAASGGWPALPSTLRLKPGDRNPIVPALVKRLAITGDYKAAGRQETDLTYDDGLQEAVKSFQLRHGLTSDGVVGKEVVAELNVPAAERVNQIALNMERLRWLPRDLGTRHILVNIPEYRLEVRDHGTVALSMRTIVGKKDSQTPSFSAEMAYAVFAPFWNVPADIAEKETLPEAMRDPAFLRRTNMEVVDKRGQAVELESVDLSEMDMADYRFRQRPGASNSLGLVKFMFPNPYNVYLHDTPADALFTREVRAFSHGCVRIEEPEKLAEYVLRDQPEWTPDRIREAMHASEQTHVMLREKIPVYFAYLTARASADGQVFFFRDVYGRDSSK